MKVSILYHSNLHQGMPPCSTPPLMHYHLINSDKWTTVAMGHHTHNLFTIQLDHPEGSIMQFVFCDSDKIKWDNPQPMLSPPETIFKLQEEKQYNYMITHAGSYFVINHSLFQLKPTSLQIPNKTLIVLKFDGVMVGDIVSQVRFNNFWISSGLALCGNIRLVYVSGRNINQILAQNSILLPHYILAQSGTQMYKYDPQLQGFELTGVHILEKEQLQAIHGTVSQLEKLSQISKQQKQGVFSLRVSTKHFNTLREQFLLAQSAFSEKDLALKILETEEYVYVDIVNKATENYKTSLLNQVKQMEKGFQINGVKSLGLGCNFDDAGWLKGCDLAYVPANITQLVRDTLKDEIPGLKVVGAEFAQSIIVALSQIYNL